MKEICFRGKSKESKESKENKKWCYGLVDISATDVFHCCPIINDGEHRSMVDKKTIGQFTGLKDKYETKIFEGDILKESSGDDVGVVRYEDDDGMFVLVVDDVIYNFSNIDSKWYEVIGNIHDNPELLGGEDARN